MNSKGTTLIELIVAIVLLGVIGLFTFQFLGSSVETYIMASRQAGRLAEAKLAMERMAREIRDAGTFVRISPNSLNIIKSHSTAVDSTTNITFQKSGSNLTRKRMDIPGPPELLAENVSSYSITTDSNEIKLELTLSLAGGESVTLHTKVSPKNVPFASSEDFSGTEFNGEWKEVVQ